MCYVLGEMAQLHFYVPDELADRLKEKAKTVGLSLSKYLAAVVTKEVVPDEWPPGYFEKVLGAWR